MDLCKVKGYEIMKNRILAILKEIQEEILNYEDDNMILDGVINSFQILEIIAVLEEEFDIEIDAQYIVAENFANKEAIIALVEKLLL